MVGIDPATGWLAIYTDDSLHVLNKSTGAPDAVAGVRLQCPEPGCSASFDNARQLNGHRTGAHRRRERS